MKCLLITIFALTATITGTMTGRVVRVVDGDTIIILTEGNKQERIRLAEIDAPEKGQPFCDKSTKFLAGMVAGKTVSIEFKARDMYGRILGAVIVDGRSVNEEMVKMGLAWKYYYSRDKRIARLEAEARRKKLNIFSEANPVNPYYYRRKK
jgi:endonuclease YncB( thermonuclease family)